MDEATRRCLRSDLAPLLAAVERERGSPCDDALLLALAAAVADMARRGRARPSDLAIQIANSVS